LDAWPLLIDIYPTKDVEDFKIQRKAATVSFLGTGLSVDIVPVIEDPKRPGYGWQFDLQEMGRSSKRAPHAKSSSCVTGRIKTRISGRWFA
jgi:hypothetical protein